MMIVGVVVKSETSALTLALAGNNASTATITLAACGFVSVENQSTKRPSDLIRYLWKFHWGLPANSAECAA